VHIAHTIFFAGLIILVAVLPFSEYIISLSQFILAGSWLLSLNFKDKFIKLFHSKIFWVVAGLYIIHLLGLIYTEPENLDYALKDLRIKAPLLLLPLLFASMPRLTKTQILAVLLTFVASVFLATVHVFVMNLGWLGSEINNSRDASIFISHIRLSLMICFAAFILFYFLTSKFFQIKYHFKLILTAVFIWSIFILIYLPFITGLIVLCSSLIVYYFAFIFKLQTAVAKSAVIAIMFLLFISLASIAYHLSNQVNVPSFDCAIEIEQNTSRGNPYEHQHNNSQAENGNRVWDYVCWMELKDGWEKRSNLKFDGLDLRNQELKITLVRFLTSKNVRKDADGMKALSSEEIKAVENGLSNVIFMNGISFYDRAYQIIWEYHSYKKNLNPSGHSVAMRYEYLKTAFYVLKQSPVIGIGTGDVEEAFKQAYDEMNTKLKPKFQRRAHNQYITFALTFGLCGLLYFLFYLLYPLFRYQNEYDKLYFAFVLMMALSMVSEDTLETQVGVTLFTIFNFLFLFLAPKKLVNKY